MKKNPVKNNILVHHFVSTSFFLTTVWKHGELYFIVALPPLAGYAQRQKDYQLLTEQEQGHHSALKVPVDRISGSLE